MALRCASAALVLLLLPGVVRGASNDTLATAAERGDHALVQSLLGTGAEVNAPGVAGRTRLPRAVAADRLDVTSVLLKAGARVTVTDRYGVTPLSLASLNGDAKMIRLLVEVGADPNAPDTAGETPLMIAARTGVPEALGALIAAGARMDAREKTFQHT